mgnify:CR=1 FL=1
MEEERELLRQQLLDYYTLNIAEHTTAFEGVYPLIDRLNAHGLRWGIVTNKPWPYTEQLLQFFKFASAPCAVICPDHVSQTKPAAEPLLLACQQARCAAHEAIYIGDHQRDIDCGKNAGSPTIAVGYGYTNTVNEHKEWGANYTVETADQIWPIVNSLLN